MLLHIFNTGNRFSAVKKQLIPARLWVSLLLTALMVSSGPVPAQTGKLPEGRDISVQVEQLEEGEQISLSAAVRIMAPAETVWKVLVDCMQALEYVPDIQECEVLRSGIDDEGGHYDITRHRLKPYFFLPGVESVFRADYHYPRRIRFHKAGGELEHFSGAWVFETGCDGQTVLHYRASVDLHRHLSQRAQARILRRDVPQMLERLRELSEAAVSQGRDQDEQRS